MKLIKARKELKFAALISILFGALCLLASVIFFFCLYGKWHKFSNISDDEHVQATVSYLLLAIKAFLFMALPGCGILMIGFGWSAFRYLKMENKESQNKI